MTETNTELDINAMSNYDDLATVSIVDAAIAQDKDAFMQAFHNAVAQKVSDALEVKKVEIASNLLGQEEVPNETEGNQTEVDGSDDYSTVDAGSTEDEGS